MTPETDGHVGVAGEVEVDLEGVGQHSEPGQRRRRRVGLEDQVGDRADVVGDQDLLREADREVAETAGAQVVRGDPLAKLIGEIAIAHDRPGDQLREECDVGREVAEAASPLHPAAIEIDRVRHRLEGVERDADRQDDPQQRQLRAARAEA